ncbi:MAG: efflux RND transporter periplasmic adaptor subunit, partial [Gemmataceae bacterium]
RTKKSTEAGNEKAKADLEAAEQTAAVEKKALDRNQKQLTQSEIKAPADGIVIYIKRPWDESSRIQPGAMMYYQQPIFTLPDLSKMMVKVKVHESVVKKVMKGLPAEILIDALPNQPLLGNVETVGTLAHSEGWRGGAVKEYMTEINVKSMPKDAGLKPGMTAEVKILVKTVANALLVPVQGVTEKSGIHTVYVKKGSQFERREVKVGDSNEQYVQILEGLEEGEEVAMDARARASAELKAAKANEKKGKDGKGPDAEKNQAPGAPSTPAATPAVAAPAPGSAG